MTTVDLSLHCLEIATGQVGLVSDPLSTGSSPCFYFFHCCYMDKDQSKADIEMPLDVPHSDLYFHDTCSQTAKKLCSRCQPCVARSVAADLTNSPISVLSTAIQRYLLCTVVLVFGQERKETSPPGSRVFSTSC